VSRGRVEALFARARAGQVAIVLEELRARLSEAPDDVEAWLASGLVLADRERWAEAREALAHAASADDAPLIARVTFARALEQTGHLDGARRELARARDAAPDHVGIARSLASVLRRAGDLAEADAVLVSAANAARTDAERALVAIDRATVARAAGDLAAALGRCDEAAALDPGSADAALTAAEVHAEIADFAAALAALDALLARDAEHSGATRLRSAIARAQSEARAARLLGRPASTIAPRPGLHVVADASGAVAALFHAPAARDPRGAAEEAARFFADALGAPPSPAAAAHLLARIAAHGAVDVDDVRIAAVEHEGAAGLRVTHR
jgi:tetratricopeptide (TPR) repeat protein